MPATRTYNPQLPKIPTGDIFCANSRVLREPDQRPHTYGVRVFPCVAFATDPCRPTACATHAMPTPSPSTDHCSLLSYRYASPDGDGFPVRYSVTHSHTDHSSLITAHSSHNHRQIYPIRYSSMALAASLPAPMARMTVAAPVTISPPAKIFGCEVLPCSSAVTHP